MRGDDDRRKVAPLPSDGASISANCQRKGVGLDGQRKCWINACSDAFHDDFGLRQKRTGTVPNIGRPTKVAGIRQDD